MIRGRKRERDQQRCHRIVDRGYCVWGCTRHWLVCHFQYKPGGCKLQHDCPRRRSHKLPNGAYCERQKVGVEVKEETQGSEEVLTDTHEEVVMVRETEPTTKITIYLPGGSTSKRIPFAMAKWTLMRVVWL